MTKRLDDTAVMFAQGGPYTWEYIEARVYGKYRVRDRADNAVGSGDTQEEAEALCRKLNGKRTFIVTKYDPKCASGIIRVSATSISAFAGCP